MPRRHGPSPSCADCRATDAARRSLLGAPVSRRRLMQLGFGAAVSVYAAQALSSADVLAAAQADAASAPSAPVLVNVFLPGGMDLLDTLVPADYGRYADLRGGVKVTDPIALAGTDVRANPALGQGLGGGLAGLFARGRVGLLPGIDYAHPDLSHFNSRHFWETGRVDTGPGTGWLGRWIDRHGNTDNPFQALSLGSTLSPLLRGTGRPAAAVSSPEDAQTWIPQVWGDWETSYRARWTRLAQRTPAGAGPAAVYASARQAQRVAEQRPLGVAHHRQKNLLAVIHGEHVVDAPGRNAAGHRVGGLAGHNAGESINPTHEEAYWREAHSNQPYFSDSTGHSYDQDYNSAYRLGYESRAAHPAARRFPSVCVRETPRR